MDRYVGHVIIMTLTVEKTSALAPGSFCWMPISVLTMATTLAEWLP